MPAFGLNFTKSCQTSFLKLRLFGTILLEPSCDASTKTWSTLIGWSPTRPPFGGVLPTSSRGHSFVGRVTLRSHFHTSSQAFCAGVKLLAAFFPSFFPLSSCSKSFLPLASSSSSCLSTAFSFYLFALLYAFETLEWSCVALCQSFRPDSRCQSFRPDSWDTPKASPQSYVDPTLAHLQRFPIELVAKPSPGLGASEETCPNVTFLPLFVLAYPLFLASSSSFFLLC